LNKVSNLKKIARDLNSMHNLNTIFNKDNITKEELLEIILENSYDGIVLSDHEGRILWASRSVERTCRGVKVEQMLGKTTKELEYDGIILTQSKAYFKERPLILTQKLKTGAELLITCTRAYDANGEFIFHINILRDMTELDRLRREMEETKDLSERYYQELVELRDRMLHLDNIVVKSIEMKQVIEKAIKVARNETNVLLTGKSGVGKEVIAKIIHKTSMRKDNPYIDINCGAIPETLLESELFGYEKGAFTGANKNGKIGLMELANNGTILFDEIGDLPLALQVKLLRAIQEQVIYRIGSTRPIRLNVRILAATNKNLEEMVEKGTFREDLYYRINVIPIHIPSLQERNEDILPLAAHFLGFFNKKHGTSKTFSPDLCCVLEEYHWPGNVRELENLIERMVVISDCKILTPACLPRHIFAKARPFERTEKKYSLKPENPKTLKEIRDETEYQAIKDALKIYGGTSKAARALQVDRSTIIRKLKQYGEQ
jgi:PAS domain S-box-containing protein